MFDTPCSLSDTICVKCQILVSSEETTCMTNQTLFSGENIINLSSADFKQSLFVLRFYGLVNPMGSCPAPSVYLTILLWADLVL